MTSVCRALLVLNVAYCALAVAEDRLPGWKMFEDVERFDVAMRDRDGIEVDLRDHLPKNAWLVRWDEVREVAAWVCRKKAARAPFSFEERVRGVRVTLGPDCQVPRAPR